MPWQVTKCKKFEGHRNKRWLVNQSMQTSQFYLTPSNSFSVWFNVNSTSFYHHIHNHNSKLHWKIWHQNYGLTFLHLNFNLWIRLKIVSELPIKGRLDHSLTIHFKPNDLSILVGAAPMDCGEDEQFWLRRLSIYIMCRLYRIENLNSSILTFKSFQCSTPVILLTWILLGQPTFPHEIERSLND